VRINRELEVTAEKMVLRMQHEPKETNGLGMRNGDFMNENGGEYLGDLNERIDVLMSVRRRSDSFGVMDVQH
jgi:hypothetical protein